MLSLPLGARHRRQGQTGLSAKDALEKRRWLLSVCVASQKRQPTLRHYASKSTFEPGQIWIRSIIGNKVALL